MAIAEGRVEDEGWRVRGDGSRFWANTMIFVEAIKREGLFWAVSNQPPPGTVPQSSG